MGKSSAIGVVVIAVVVIAVAFLLLSPAPDEADGVDEVKAGVQVGDRIELEVTEESGGAETVGRVVYKVVGADASGLKVEVVQDGGSKTVGMTAKEFRGILLKGVPPGAEKDGSEVLSTEFGKRDCDVYLSTDGPDTVRTWKAAGSDLVYLTVAERTVDGAVSTTTTKLAATTMVITEEVDPGLVPEGTDKVKRTVVEGDRIEYVTETASGSDVVSYEVRSVLYDGGVTVRKASHGGLIESDMTEAEFKAQLAPGVPAGFADGGKQVIKTAFGNRECNVYSDADGDVAVKVWVGSNGVRYKLTATDMVTGERTVTVLSKTTMFSGDLEADGVDKVKAEVVTGDSVHFKMTESEDGRMSEYTSDYTVDRVYSEECIGMTWTCKGETVRYDDETPVKETPEMFRDLLFADFVDDIEERGTEVIPTAFGNRECTLFAFEDDGLQVRMWVSGTGIEYKSIVSHRDSPDVLVTELVGTTMFGEDPEEDTIKDDAAVGDYISFEYAEDGGPAGEYKIDYKVVRILDGKMIVEERDTGKGPDVRTHEMTYDEFVGQIVLVEAFDFEEKETKAIDTVFGKRVCTCYRVTEGEDYAEAWVSASGILYREHTVSEGHSIDLELVGTSMFV